MAKRLRGESTSEPVHMEAGAPSPQLDPDVQTEHTPKYASLEPDEHPSMSTMQCLLPPHHPLSFKNYHEYEMHYQQNHTKRCTDCKANLPSPHFLELHISENHDPITAARREKGEKTYACFVDGCDKICLEWRKRRSHLVDKHGYPKNYDFFIVNTGIDGKRSMLRRGVDAQGHRKSSRERRGSSVTESTLSTQATSVSVEAPSAEAAEDPMGGFDESKRLRKEDARGAGGLDDLTKSMSSLKMVPRSITFGKRKGPSGLAKS